MTRLPTPLRPLFPLAKRGVLAATEIVGPLTRRLPAPVDRPGPPRYLAASTADYATGHPDAGIDVTEVLAQLGEPAFPLEPSADHWDAAKSQFGRLSNQASRKPLRLFWWSR